MAHKDFDLAFAQARKERPTFTLGGRTFTCRPGLSTEKTLAIELETSQLIKHMTEVAEQGGEVDSYAVYRIFFDKVLIKADREPFYEFIAADEDDDDFVPIQAEQLGEIMSYIREQYRPLETKKSDDSSDTPSTTGPALKVISFAPQPAKPVEAVEGPVEASVEGEPEAG